MPWLDLLTVGVLVVGLIVVTIILTLEIEEAHQRVLGEKAARRRHIARWLDLR